MFEYISEKWQKGFISICINHTNLLTKSDCAYFINNENIKSCFKILNLADCNKILYKELYYLPNEINDLEDIRLFKSSNNNQ